MTDLVRLYLERLDGSPYVLCPEVVSDARVVSVRTAGKPPRSLIVATLRRLGYDVTIEDGVTTICPVPEKSAAVDQTESGDEGRFRGNGADHGDDRERPRQRVMGKLTMQRPKVVPDDELTALAGCGSYAAPGATADDPASFCWRELARRDEAKIARLRQLEAARTRVEGPGR